MSFKTSAYRVHIFDEDGELIRVHEMTKFPFWSDITSLYNNAKYAIVKGFCRGYQIVPQAIFKEHDLKRRYGYEDL